MHIEDRRFDVKAILFRISLAKNAFLSPEVYAARVREDVRDDEYDLIAAEMYPRYEAQLQQLHALDFDDLITRTVRLIEENEGVRERWGNRFHYVMVDEYQDTNRAQFKLMEHLVARTRRTCAWSATTIQSIYGWRGAEAGHILEFERQFPGAKVVRLEENYRSTPQILNAANGVISHNVKRHKKTLWTARPPGEKLRLIVADDAEAEANFVAEEIELLRATRNYRLADCAVLYRSNIQARALEESLRAQRLEYEVVGGQSFFERKEVKDAIAYLKLAMHPRDEIALRRIINYPARGIGATTIDKLAAWAKANGKTLSTACDARVAHAYVVAQASGDGLFGLGVPADLHPEPAFALVGTASRRSLAETPQLETRQRQAVAGFSDLMQRGRAHLGSGVLLDGVRAFLKETGIDEDIRASAPSGLAAQRRLENLEGFLLSLGRFQERAGAGAIDALGAYLHRLMLKSQDDDAEAEEQDRITLVTLHGSKGLEFPVVFIVGMEEELLPHRRTLYPQGPDVTQASAAGVEIDLGEERRLLYVGITRAREQLYLTRCRARTSRASQKPRAPSRFLEEIPPELIELREASTPAVAVEDEDAFARASLEKLRQMMADWLYSTCRQPAATSFLCDLSA